MATLIDLRNAISTLLNLPGIPAVLQLNSATRERAFEAYVFSLIVRAIRQANGRAGIYGIISGPNPPIVVFRGGPGLLGSAAQDYVYADCRLGDKEFEIHVDVKYEGGSGALHEIDVSLYDHESADRIRQSTSPNVFAKSNKLIGAVECKFYDSSMGTVLGRTFVGLVDDCGTLQLRMFVTNGTSQALVRYFRPKKRPNRFFHLSPLRPAEEQEFVDFVTHTLSEWAGVA